MNLARVSGPKARHVIAWAGVRAANGGPGTASQKSTQGLNHENGRDACDGGYRHLIPANELVDPPPKNTFEHDHGSFDWRRRPNTSLSSAYSILCTSIFFPLC